MHVPRVPDVNNFLKEEIVYFNKVELFTCHYPPQSTMVTMEQWKNYGIIRLIILILLKNQPALKIITVMHPL